YRPATDASAHAPGLDSGTDASQNGHQSGSACANVAIPECDELEHAATPAVFRLPKVSSGNRSGEASYVRADLRESCESCRGLDSDLRPPRFSGFWSDRIRVVNVHLARVYRGITVSRRGGTASQAEAPAFSAAFSPRLRPYSRAPADWFAGRHADSVRDRSLCHRNCTHCET